MKDNEDTRYLAWQSSLPNFHDRYCFRDITKQVVLLLTFYFTARPTKHALCYAFRCVSEHQSTFSLPEAKLEAGSLSCDKVNGYVTLYHLST